MHQIDAQSLIDPTALSKSAVAVVARLCENNHSAFIVGGAVRDLLLGKRPKDFDVATDATPEQIVALFRGARIIGRRFQIVHVRMGREIIEVTTFRGHHGGDTSKIAAKSNKGLLLRDNVYGTLDQDAARRDLTINALYLDPLQHLILDDLNGIEDIKKRTIRIIGDPAGRYREDPVRMLRVARFAAKLGFSVDPATQEAIGECRHLLADIPSARLFDEAIKLFMSGHAAETFEQLRRHDLLETLFPEAVDALDLEGAQELITQAMKNTDGRIARDKPVTPAFLFAALLWPAVALRSDEIVRAGNADGSPVNAAGQEILARSLQRVSIPKRFSIPMREIWELQPRLDKCSPKRAKSILALRRFRAAFDLLLLRRDQDEELSGAVKFWEEQQQLFPEIVGSQPPTEIPKKRRRPRRRKPEQ
ncbi:MAG: poly(A) polymerase [Cellvibrionales bacterium TMED79]|uniref:Poly(A) polymerase I n=1 Tax=Candidatus Paraluminiphilus aquimaris TaxID=2518994 RepID=A0ABY6Q2V4_9GAMM|nr:polynucleotide adenylyltransferase PcnB [Candidatus Paraluminiphilus aquimaris]MAJ53836.1 poly(A) polymerase [Halieaceae bacterium]OUU99259.1 MAG: poly(A) polymerase [Cellvibrionales bacterium TMED79]UZP73254.1 polynucleotide adenylyltransferase PcnB [Candidatus Paraluminiphilus aquimaris]